MFADQLEQQPSSHTKVEQPEPEPEPEPRALDPESELMAHTLRPAQQPEQLAMHTAVAMRGSHSPARLEEISICADVHPSKLLTDLTLPNETAAACSERYSGVAIKDEIELFTDVDLGNGAHYYAF